MGIYRQKYKAADGTVRESPYWSISYYDASGKQQRETTQATKRKDAQAVLDARRNEHRVIGAPVVSRDTTLREILFMVQDDYLANHRKSALSVRYPIQRLMGFFGFDCKARDVNSANLTKYVQDQQGKGKASATINQDLAILHRAFSLACDAGLVAAAPRVKKLKLRNARKGFFEVEAHRAVVANLPGYLKPLAEVAYMTGMRAGELLGLRWPNVNFDNGWIRLEPGPTKNDEGRVIPMTQPLRAVLEAQQARVREVGKTLNRIIPEVFIHFGMERGTAAEGSPIKDYRAAWKAACVAAGCPGRLMHDYRRTQVRNLEKAGVSRSAAMAITGHKTEAVYRRYAIVDSATLQDAGEKLNRVHASQS